MKKLILFFTSVSFFTGLHLNAQTTVFEETFESTTESEIPSDWTRENRDNDNQMWKVTNSNPIYDSYGFSGKFVSIAAMIASDNLLITKDVNLQPGYSYSLSFQIGTWVPSPSFTSNNHYAIYVLPANTTFTGTETPVLEEDITTGNTAFTKTVDLSTYAGQDIKVYFRQFAAMMANPFPLTRYLILDTVKITQNAILGTSEKSVENELAVYPNPASEFVYIKSKSKIQSMEIFDMSGRKIATTINDNKISVSKLQPGTYQVHIISENKAHHLKIIKK